MVSKGWFRQVTVLWEHSQLPELQRLLASTEAASSTSAFAAALSGPTPPGPQVAHDTLHNACAAHTCGMHCRGEEGGKPGVTEEEAEEQ